MAIRRSFDETREKLNEIGFTLLEDYRDGYIQKVKIEDKSGYRYDVSFMSLLKHKNPDFVNLKNPNSLYNIKIWVTNNTDFRLTDENEYLGNKSLLRFYCFKCDDFFYSSWDNVYSGHGCGVCDKKQCGEKHSFGQEFPELIPQWSEKNKVSPYEITSGYRVEDIIWKCNTCKHEWKKSIREKLRHGDCPKCNSLLMVYPDIASEWHPKLNGNINPEDVSYGSNINAWWLCGNGHKFKSPVSRRTNMKTGCPKCKSSKGEKRIRDFLIKNNISFETQIPIKNKNGKLFLDFYLHDYRLAIEYDGEQHFYPVDFAGKGEKWAKREFDKIKKRDKAKNKYCKENNINLLRIPYWEFDNIEKILCETLEELERS